MVPAYRAGTLQVSDPAETAHRRHGDLRDLFATTWQGSSRDSSNLRALHAEGAFASSASSQRPPSPIAARPSGPLPLPWTSSGPSPLAGLIDYPELLPHLLLHFERPAELAILAGLRPLSALAQKKLYEHVWVRPWEQGCHLKLVLLFEALSTHSDLCKLIKRLDVRFFPLAARGSERTDLDDKIRAAIGAMANLEELVWTRDKSLHSELIEDVSRLQYLRYLEISGHSYRYYDPRLIGRMPALEGLRVMMPDTSFGEAIIQIVRDLHDRPRGGLRTLELICRSSPLITDDMLKSMSPHLSELTKLAFWGCTRITGAGLSHVLAEAIGLQDLSIDALPHSGILDLSQLRELPLVHSISISISAPHRTPLYLENGDLPVLPHLPALTSFHVSLSGARGILPKGGIEHLAAQVDFRCLNKLSLLNIVIDGEQLAALLLGAPNLEELYICISDRMTIIDCAGLSQVRLRVLHVVAREKWGPTIADLTGLAKRLPFLEQTGMGNRFYEILRSSEGVHLVKWGRMTPPAYFQYWRG